MALRKFKLLKSDSAYPGNVLNFGALGEGNDDTVAFNEAIQFCIDNAETLFIPAGTFRITSALDTIPGSMSVIGAGSLQTTIDHDPSSDGYLFKISNGAQRAAHFTMRGLRIYSSDTTYAKTAIIGQDLSVCEFEDIYVHGTGGTGALAGVAYSGGSGNGSKAFELSGREACSFRRITAFSDSTVHFTANPNTSPTDGEDIDHWHFEDCYVGATTGHYIWTVADGLGVISLTFDGYQAWIGGDGGFKMNDNRSSPTIPSRHLMFANIRGEQGFNTAGYWFNIVATEPIQQILFENCLGANGTNGILLNAVHRCSIKNATMATTSGTSLSVSGATSRSVIDMIGCNWQFGSTFTLTGYTPTSIKHYDAANYAGPSTATYVSVRTDTKVDVALVQATCADGATGLRVTGTTGDRLDVNPQAAGSGVQDRSLNNAGTDYEPRALYAETVSVHARTGVGTVAESLRVDASVTAGQTRLLVYDVDNATLERVTVGAAGSGGAGFKVLRIPN